MFCPFSPETNCHEYGDSQMDKPQRGRPKRAELSDVSINTGAQSIDTERTSLMKTFHSLAINPLKFLFNL